MIGSLLKENLELVDTFANMFKKCNQIDQFIDLYEALHYELKIRCQEASTLINGLNVFTT